jgi:hypothetical protein
MATVSDSLKQIKAHLEERVSEKEVFGICAKLGHAFRKRILDPAVTVQIFLLQLLAKVAMDNLCHVARISVSAAAICKAKKRLPLQLLMELVARSAPQEPDGAQESRWKKFILYLVDGMSFMTPDTPELAQRYGKPKNHRGTSFGYPAPKLLALMDAAGGFIRKVIALPWARQEFTCLSRLFKAIGRGGLLLGDRGLVSFAHMALLIQAEIQGCFRLPRWQVVFNRGKASRHLIKRLGRQDLLVRWTAYRCPKWLGKKRWEALARQELTLRQISFRVCRKGFRTQWAWIVTTLLDPQQYPAQELIELYSKRWQIEVYFRDLKRTLGLSLLSAKTVLGVRKEILAFVLLYNLIRGVMKQAAIQQGEEPDRISFTAALNWLLWASPGEPVSTLKVNRRCVRRSPARKLKNARHRFSQLNGSRAETGKPACRAKL